MSIFNYLLLAIWLTLTASPTLAANNFYCCADPATGRRVCGDTLPDICRGRPYRILDSSGNVTKEVGPPLTPAQKQELAAETLRQKQLEEAKREQRRKDQALLDTYATQQDIDLAQKKAENDVTLAMSTTQGRIDAARLKRKKFEAEAEFYQKKTLPAELAKELQALDHEIKVQQELLDVKKQDFVSIKTKFDADRKRYLELTGRSSAARPTN